MATFIKGMTDDFGPMQLYKPDYGFLTQVYGTKQAEYDRGFNMVKSLYNSMLNNPLTNQDNQNFRAEAFKKLQGTLRSVTATDLSNPTNIMRAQSLIAPISQDEDLAYDMAVTRFHSKQKQIMDQYKNSTDPKMRAMYSDFSKMDIAFAEEDLRNAKRGDGSIRSVQPREFTPFEDVMEYLRTAAAKDKLEIKQAGPDGKGYIIERLNGEGAVPIFTDWAKAAMGNRFDRQFQVMGRVQAESAIRSEMNEKGISRQQAIDNIATKLLPVVNEREASVGIHADKELTRIEGDIKIFEKEYPNGFPADKPHIKEAYEQLLKDREDYKNKLDGSRSEVSRMQEEGPGYVASNIYGIFTKEAINQTAFAFGSSAAMGKQSVEYRPDTTWATKQNIAMQQARLAWDKEKHAQDMAWDKYKFDINTELKMTELKGKGYIGTEQYIGPGVSQGRGSDVVSSAFAENRQKTHNAAFNADNGLMKLVLGNDDKRYGEVYGVIAKLQSMAGGQQVKLSEKDRQVLQLYGKEIGINIKIPGSASQANAVLDGIAGYTYTAASKKLETYSRANKTGSASKYMQAFDQAADAFYGLQQERQQLNKEMQRISKEVVAADGTINPLYKGAKIRGRLAGGGYDLDLTGISDAAAYRLKSVISSQFDQRANSSTNNYLFSKLSAAEIDIMLKNPYGPSKITTSDGATINTDALRNMNATDLATLFGDQSKVFYDDKKQQVKIELNVSQKAGWEKKLGYKGTQSLYLTIPYSTITSSRGALNRFEKYIQPNSTDNSALGMMEDFLTNPRASVNGKSYHAAAGFDYKLQGVTGADGSNQILFTYDMYDPSTRKVIQQSQRLKFTVGDINSLRQVQQVVTQAQKQYMDMRAMYENQ